MIQYCVKPDCSRQAVYKAQGVCVTHYRQNQRAIENRQKRVSPERINKDLLWEFVKKELQLQ